MTIISVYVYNPFNAAATITGLSTYCGTSTTHGPCNSGYSNPVDIAATGIVNLRVNTNNCKSCLIHVAYACCTGYSGCSNEYRRIVIADLYGRINGACFMGSVAFGHIGSLQVNDGVLYNLTTMPFPLGTATSGGCPDTPPKCSTGTHCHMEIQGGYSQSLSCGAISAGTAIYRFTWDDSIPCSI